MTTALIILLIATLSEPVFSVDKLPAEIRENVSGEEEKSRLLDLTKEGKKRIKKFQKEEKKARKKLRKVVVNETNSIVEIDKHYELSIKRTLSHQSFLVTTRLEMQKLTADDEWNNIINSAAYPSKKKLRKSQKSRVKEDKLIRKKFSKMREVLEAEIENPDKEALITEQIIVLEKDVFDYLEILRKHTFLDNPTVRDHNATREDLEQLLAKDNLFRKEVIASFTKLYKSGSENLSSTEWNAVKQQLKKLVN